MQTSTKVIGGLIALALIIGGFFFFRGSAPQSSGPPAAAAPSFGAVSNTNAPAAGSTSASGTILPNPSVFDYLVSRTYLYFDKALGFGNSTATPINEQAARAATVATSSVLCAVQNPLNASSSIMHVSIFFTTAPTSTLSLVVGTTTFAQAQYATSSGMMTISVPVSATSTSVDWDPGINNDGIAAGQWITFGVGGGSSGVNFGGVGNCNALFITDN